MRMMVRLLRELFASMFHRRLLLIGAAVLVAVQAIGAQLVRLTVIEGDKWRAEAESVLTSHRLLPTTRGQITDGRGRLLARDVTCDDVKVHYDIIADRWAYRQARRAAYRANRDRWPELDQTQRELLIRKEQQQFDRQVELLWREICERGLITREELERRKDAIVRRVAMVQSSVWERQAQRQERREGEAAELSDVAIRVAEQNQHHTILTGVDGETAAYFRKRELTFDGLKVEASTRRAYFRQHRTVEVDRSTMPSPIASDTPLYVHVRGVGHHLVGAMRDVWAEDVDPDAGGRPYRRADGSVDLGGYLPGDRIGMRGVEWAEERQLRGSRGRQSLRRDTDEVRTVAPRAGQNVQITVDIYGHIKSEEHAEEIGRVYRPEKGPNMRLLGEELDMEEG